VFPNSPAAEGGLLAGDLLLSVNGRPIRTGQDLSSLIRLGETGETLDLEVARNRERIHLDVTTRLMPDSGMTFEPAGNPE